MTSLSSSASGKPLRLKDFLEEDTHLESWGDAFGFQGAPRRLPDHTVRYLLAVELGDSNRGDRAPLGRRRRPDGALTKLSALMISAVKMAPFLSSTSSAGPHDCPEKPGLRKQGGLLARSFSRKLRRGFWRKWEKVEHRVSRVASVPVRDVVRLRSFGDDSRPQEEEEEEEEEEEDAAKTASRSPPSPVRSTTSGSGTSHGLAVAAWSATESTGSDSFSGGEDSNRSPNEPPPGRCTCPGNPSHLVRGVGEDSTPKPACHLERKAKVSEEAAVGGGKGMEGCSCHFEEEKEQLSPVSVMDFPFDDEENDGAEAEEAAAAAAAAAAASPVCFDRSLANLERTKLRLLQKIREFESLAALVEPVDLDSRFASAGEDETEPDRAVGKEGDPEAAFFDDQLVQFRMEIDEQRAVALLNELERRIGGGSSSPASKAVVHSIDELLVDFFVERLSCARCQNTDLGVAMKWRRDRASGAEDEKEEEAMLRAAEQWIVGGRRHGKQEARGWAAELREMEVGGDWRCAHVEEEKEIAGDLGGAVLDSLVGELVVDVFLDSQKSLLSAHRWIMCMGSDGVVAGEGDEEESQEM